MKLGQAIYEKEQQPRSFARCRRLRRCRPDEDVVDAEFSEVDDNKA
jgi:molecular chaperone DnaK